MRRVLRSERGRVENGPEDTRRHRRIERVVVRWARDEVTEPCWVQPGGRGVEDEVYDCYTCVGVVLEMWERGR